MGNKGLGLSPALNSSPIRALAQVGSIHITVDFLNLWISLLLHSGIHTQHSTMPTGLCFHSLLLLIQF